MDLLKEEDITIFAKTNFRGEEKSFGIKPDDRRRHMYIIGKTGMGKSVLLKNLVIQDIQKGKGVAFVDPHGDSAEDILNFIPKSRINDVVYFNPADLSNPIAFNILEAVDEDHKHLIASGMMGVFKKIWPDVWSPRMEYILSNTILALLDYPGSTMLGINRMTSNKDFRRQVIDKVRDPIVRSFWLEEFEKWEPRFAREATAAIQNKVGQFVSTPIVRHIVGQPKSTINMREIMDEGKILIVNLSKGRIGEEAMALLGGMVVTRLYLAAMERVDISESNRKDFFLYVDEFQNFATESFASILSEARKYRLSLIVAHQYMAQLSEEVRDAVFGNVGTLVSFRIGASDAESLEKEFEPVVMMNDLVNLPKYNIYLKLMIDGVTGNAFSAKSLPPFTAPPISYADKVVKVSQERYGNPRQEVETKIAQWMDKEFDTRGPNQNNNRNQGGYQRTPDNLPFGRPYSENAPKKHFPKRTERYMSPSQIIGFNDEAIQKVEDTMKKEMETKNPKSELTPEKTAPDKEITEKEISEKPEVIQEPVSPQINIENKPNQETEKEPPKIQEPIIQQQREDDQDTQPNRPQLVWEDAICDRCGKKTKVPFKPEEGRGVFCKECLREVRRQKAFTKQTGPKRSLLDGPNLEQEKQAKRNFNRVSEEKKEKLKEDLRKLINEVRSSEE